MAAHVPMIYYMLHGKLSPEMDQPADPGADIVEALTKRYGEPLEITLKGREIIELEVEPASDFPPETPQKRIVSDS